MSIHKQILPQAYDYGQAPVEIVGIDSTKLNKQAMRKRAAAFDDVIADLKPRKDRAYLHVITTGQGQTYGPNGNGDFWVGYAHQHTAPFPKCASVRTIMLDGGLQKYHDSTYMKKAHVYQQHKTQRQGGQSSGQVIAARYNTMMKRGQLLIAVDTQKWADRLQKKASGHDIFLSIGADVSHDTCSYCHNKAHNVGEYCCHVKKAKLQVDEQGNQVYMLNEDPSFYDISGVNVPADKMAYVIRKVASGIPTSLLYKQASLLTGKRRPMLLTKAASLLSKLAKIQKRIICKLDDDATFADDPRKKDKFIRQVEIYPVDQVISGCNRKGILLSPDMLFKLMGKQTSDPMGFFNIAQNCCGDCAHLFQDMQEDDDFRDDLIDGQFDTITPPDLRLQDILNKFVPDFATTPKVIAQKAINIVIRGDEDKVNRISKDLQSAISDTLKKYKDQQSKKDSQDDEQTESVEKKASAIDDAFKRTYARYVISFASQNSDQTCRLALQKIARYNKVQLQ